MNVLDDLEPVAGDRIDLRVLDRPLELHQMKIVPLATGQVGKRRRKCRRVRQWVESHATEIQHIPLIGNLICNDSKPGRNQAHPRDQCQQAMG